MAALASAPRRTYAERVAELADKINAICMLRGDSERWHETKDDAARTARRIAAALTADGL